MADPFAPRSMKRKNVKGLALTPAAPKPPPTAENQIDDPYRDDNKDGKLEIGIEYKLDLKPEDLEVIKDLGSGNGGTVSKVRHLTTGTVMARKVRLPCPLLEVHINRLGDSCRGQARDAKANRSRAPDYAWLSFGTHCDVLRRLLESQQRCHHVHGVYGCWVG